jgi:hypothetical protein
MYPLLEGRMTQGCSSRENGLLAEGLDAYPNLKAIIEGRIAGNFREWPAVRGELERLLMDQAELMRKASDALQSYRLASSETASIPLNLQPHAELIALAEKLSKETPAHWTSGEKRALLGFLNLHVGYHTVHAHRHTIPQGGEHG